jgi:hypothetical protein
MSQVIDRPDILNAPKFFDDLDTSDKDELGNDPNFPDAVIMIGLGGGKYCAINLTTSGPDPMTVNFLVCFATDKEAEIWESSHMTGEHVNKEFQEAREIAVSKSNIHGLALIVGGQARHIHWVR